MLAGKGCTPSHSEVWVLVNGAGDEALDVPLLPKHVRECGGEGRRSLHCWECHLPDVGLPLEAKDAPRGVVGDAPAALAEQISI